MSSVALNEAWFLPVKVEIHENRDLLRFRIPTDLQKLLSSDKEVAHTVTVYLLS